MTMLPLIRNLALCLSLVSLSACGDEDPSKNDGASSSPSSSNGPTGPTPSNPNGQHGDPDASTDPINNSSEQLLPLAPGNTWTYRVTKNDVVTEKIQTVGEEEAVGGIGPSKDVRAFRVVSSRRNATRETVSWQKIVGEQVLRYREQRFSESGDAQEEEHWDPYKLRVDWSAERVVVGANWIEQYGETLMDLRTGTNTSTQTADRWEIKGVNVTVTVPAGTFTNAIEIERMSAGGTATRKSYWFVRGVGKLKETGGQTEELVSYEVAP